MSGKDADFGYCWAAVASAAMRFTVDSGLHSLWCFRRLGKNGSGAEKAIELLSAAALLRGMY